MLKIKEESKLVKKIAWLFTIVLVISGSILIYTNLIITDESQYIESMFGYNIFSPPKNRIVYSGGYPNSSAPYEINFVLKSSDFSENHQFTGTLSLVRNAINESQGRSFEFHELNVNTFFLTEIVNATSEGFKGTGIRYYNVGSFKAMPFDKYYIIITLFNTTLHHQVPEDQIYVSSNSLSDIWKATDISVEMLPQMTQFSIVFEFSRNDFNIIENLSIPILLLVGIFVTFFSTSLIKTKNNERDIKFRVDTAKWVLALGIANILFNPDVIGVFNVKSVFSAIAIFLSILYYFISRYDDTENTTMINYGIAGLSIALLIIMLILNIIH